MAGGCARVPAGLLRFAVAGEPSFETVMAQARRPLPDPRIASGLSQTILLRKSDARPDVRGSTSRDLRPGAG